jgi:diguanylate cyclase (GGDEF)-like protein/PAS domain S-box-containing protein
MQDPSQLGLEAESTVGNGAAPVRSDPDLHGVAFSPGQRTLFGIAFSHAPIGMAIVDVTGQIVIANDALGRITGYSPQQLSGRTIADLIMPEDRELQDGKRSALIAGETSSYEASIRAQRADGSAVWVALTASRDGVTAPVTLIYQFQDISERHEFEDRLRYMVDHDLLTGLFNRRRFAQELTRQVQRTRRTGEAAAVMIVDLDGFKHVNDQFGHAVGDELLSDIAASLRARSRETDLLARLSGDEFAILLPGAGRTTAEIVAAEMVALIHRQVTMEDGRRAQVTASVGVALLDGLTEAEVLTLADTAMYAAKQAGRNGFVVLERDESRTPRARQVGEVSLLRRALADQRFVLHCQAVHNLAERSIETYELLIRMRDETSPELIPPNAFLYAAERFGLIGAIDSWVVSQAVRLIAEQNARGRRVVLSVNLSGRSVSDPSLNAHIDRVLRESEIDPSCLIFELAETAAIGNIGAAVAFSQRLQERGCGFALDDFGAGFASFYYLKKLPFDFLKIDGDLVRGLPRSPVDRLVIDAIVTIARGLGKHTVAEFVGDQETSDLLLASGVDYAQGFHFGVPRPIEDVLAGI